MSKLLINESGQSSVFELFEDEATIGRGASNAIQVADAHASKNHAVIRRIGGRLKLVDLESKNGTRVNGELRNQRWLSHGDTVAIGAAVLTYDGAGDVAVTVRPGGGHAAVGVAHAPPAAARVAATAASAARAPAYEAPARTGGGRAGGARAGSRRGRDDDEDGEPRRRLAPKKSGAPMALLVGAGVVGFMAIMFMLLSRGSPKNAMALREAKNIYSGGNIQAALDFLAVNADPSDVDGYVSVQVQIDTWKGQLADTVDSAKETESNTAYNKLYRQFVEWWKTNRPQDEFGDLVLAYVTQYEGTLKVKELLHADGDPYPKLRALLQKAKDKKNQGK